MNLIQEEKDKLYGLIDKISPCAAMGSREAIEKFKEYAEGQVKTFEIPNSNNFLCEDKIYLIPVDPPNKPIKIFIEGGYNEESYM